MAPVFAGSSCVPTDFEALRQHVLPTHFRDDLMQVHYPKSPNIFGIAYGKEMKSLPIRVDFIKSGVNSLQNEPTKDEKLALRGIIDTGAQSICARHDACWKMGFEKIGYTHVSGANTSSKVTVYRGDFRLAFQAPVGCDFIHVFQANILETNLPGDIDVLIGQPVLKRFDLKIKSEFRGVQFLPAIAAYVDEKAASKEDK